MPPRKMKGKKGASPLESPIPPALSPTAQSNVQEESNTEALPPIQIPPQAPPQDPPPFPPPKMKKKSVALPSNRKVQSKPPPKAKFQLSNFTEAIQNVEATKEEYVEHGRTNLLEEIMSFDKSKLKNPNKDEDTDEDDFGNVRYYSEDENTDEEGVLKSKGQKVKKSKLRLKKATKVINQDMLCYKFWDETSFPVHKLKYIILQLDAKADYTLDLSGISQLNDYVMALWLSYRKVESVRFDSVNNVILDGCDLITDQGLSWMAQTFPNLEWLSLIGCSKVTEWGLIQVAKVCTKLKSVDLSSTGAVFLPKQWSADGMKMTCCPMLYPLAPADMDKKAKAMTMKGSKQLLKICILTRDKGSTSLLAALKGDKQGPSLSAVTVEHGLAVDENITATAVEARQMLSKNIVTNRSVVIIPSDLKDKNKIEEEAAAITALIVEINTKFPQVPFILVGCNSDAAGIVPTGLVKEAVENSLKKIALVTNNYAMSDEKLSIDDQLNYSSARRMYTGLSMINITSMEINVDKEKQEKAVLLQAVSSAAKNLDTLQEVDYPDEIHTWAKTFHSKFPKGLLQGVKTLTDAAKIIQENSNLKERLRAFGAVDFLASIGQLTTWTNMFGETFVANTSWLSNYLNVLMSAGHEGSINNGSNPTLSDNTSIWTKETLEGEVGKKKLDLKQLDEVISHFPQLVTFAPRSTPVTAVGNLDKASQIDLKTFSDFEKNANDGTLHITYSYALNQFVTPSLMQTILSRAMMIHRPIHQWKHGVIIYDSIVAVMIGHVEPPSKEEDGSGYSKLINLCAYTMDSPIDEHSKNNSEHPVTKSAKLIWNTVKKYQLAILHTLREAGLIWETIFRSSAVLAQEPEGSVDLAVGHNPSPMDKTTCKYCGTSSKVASLLTSMDLSVRPQHLNESVVKMKEEIGKVTGGLIEITSQGISKIWSSIDPLGSRQSSILLLKDLCILLNVSFVGQDTSRVTIDLEERIIRWAVKTSGTMGHSEDKIPDSLRSVFNQGTRITARLRGEQPLYMDIYFGPYLVASNEVPFQRYTISIDSSKLPNDHSTIITAVSSSFVSGAPELVKGMRLEALDRLTPNLICVATIEDINEDTGQVLIHFDGWTARYDYWTDFSSHDLHPLGYMKHNGHRLKLEQGKTSALQPPNRYPKEFDWLTYLQEVEASPVPYDLFSPEQLEGTPNTEIIRVESGLSFVPDMSGKNKSSCRSIIHRPEVLEYMARQKTEKVKADLNSEDVDPSKFLENKYTVCFLPQSLNLEFLRYPNMKEIYSLDKQAMHFICPGQVLDFHMANVAGLNLDTKQLSNLQDWSGYLQNIYSLLLAQKGVLPRNKSSICPGSEKVPADQSHQLEMALKRLLFLYFQHMVYLGIGNKDLSKVLTNEQTVTIQEILKTVSATPGNQFIQQFSVQQQGSEDVLCYAHQLADSPSSSVGEIKIEDFQGLAGNIIIMHLENNPLSSLPEDFFDHFTNLSQLWLDGCKLTELPPLKQNTCLEELHLKGNQLQSLPADMKQLTSLKILDLSNNPLEIVPPVLSSIASLVDLSLDNVGTVNLKTLCPLKALTKLSVSHNLIEAVPAEFSDLPLISLNMVGLPLISLGTQFSAPAVNAFLDQYVVYRRINSKERQAILEKMENQGEQATSSAKMAVLNQILFEKYARLGQLSDAKQDPNIPDSLYKLKTLQRLNISYQGFTTVSEKCQDWTHLEYLNVTNNPVLESVSAELARLPLKELHLRDCVSLKTPPKEVVRRGFLAVFGYLKRLLQGSVPCKRTKLMMVGLGGAGKTSLVRALTSKRFQSYHDYGEQITDGIDITEWDVDTSGFQGVEDENKKEPLHFSVWDFAGQTVYYNTHQFFLSNRAVYLLLWNIRLGFEHAGLDFWLSSIACHAPKAPIFVVGTHCDKVERGKLPVDELKRRFPQICGFYYVSSYSGEGVPGLREDIIKIALKQKYMGEKIPEAWLNLETRLDDIRKKKSLLPWQEVEEVASASGIFDNSELVQAVQFLHDLGSVQFFNTIFLRSHVVIVPQWIVDVMACVVTVHEGPIKNGKLLYANLKDVWSKYEESLHPWLLRLTEEFDLTFPLPSEEANIVPCLLPNTEPEYDFAPLNKDQGEREFRMIYRFEYLPAGLFNRAQTRLHQFSDSAIMWKKGFMLKKNNHRALLLQTSPTEVSVTARGYKPENILFLVHEVFECLIADCYSGVHYDFSLPCLECMAQASLEPSMFPASKVKKALDLKAPFLQCDSSFHIISIPEIQAIMPPDSSSDFDEHLGRSMVELKELQQGGGVSTRVFFIYSKRNIPDLANEGKVVNPTQVIEDLRAAGFNVSYCDEPETASRESLIVSIKSTQIVLFAISDEYVESDKCRDLIIYVKQTLHKTILLLAMGKTLNWMKTDINLILADEIFVKMTQVERYSVKLPELVDAIHSRTSKKKIEYPECFISYAWANSKTAVSLGSATVEGAIGWGDPRKLKKFLESHGIKCWLDVEQMGQEGFFEDIADGLRKAKVMVACVSDEYANSKNCRMEFRFAVSTLRIPTVLAVVGTGYEWERTEIGLLTVGNSQSCPKINFQYKNEAGLLDLLHAVQNFLPKDSKNGDEGKNTKDHSLVAFQEVLELTQRKLLRHIIKYSDDMDVEEYPRLVLVDFLEEKEEEKKDSKTPEPPKETVEETQEKTDEQTEEIQKEAAVKAGLDASGQKSKSNKFCFRLLCEHEQGWHESPLSIPFPDLEGAALDDYLKSIAPYVARLFAVLKHTNLNLLMLTTPQGEKLRLKLEEWCTRSVPEFQREYNTILDSVLNHDEERTYGGLKKCHMPNGKTLWLCEEHVNVSFTLSEEKYKDHLLQGPTKPSKPKESLPREESALSDAISTVTTTDSYAGESTAESVTPVPTDQSSSSDTAQVPQVKVKSKPIGGHGLTRRPKPEKRLSKKTTSQACLLM